MHVAVQLARTVEFAEDAGDAACAVHVGNLSEIDSIYNTEIGKVNIALAASSEVIDGNPDLVKVAIEAHKKATEQ